MVRGYSLLHIAFEAAVVPVLALVATSPSFGRRLRSAAASFGLLSCSAVLVHLSGGVIEMHFHFFVMVAVVALYQDWICFLAAIAYVLVHHGVLGAIDPGSVFNHYAALNHPWKWAAIHAFFVAGISVACLVTWRENEQLIAAHAAVAVDNARLYEAEHQSREFAERAQRRLAVLADASRVLASSLDVDQILGDLADIAAPGMGDRCVVYLAGGDGTLRPVVTGPADQAAGSRPPLPPPIGAADAGDPIARSFGTGHSLLLDEPCDELRLVAGAGAGAADGPPATSGLVVALDGREGPLGALALTTTSASGRRLGGDDVSLAEELGRRAAVAVEHARLYASQRSAAETLQHSLLPEVLPELPGVEIASRYQAGGPGVDIGGDWYDVLALTDGRLALAMGDVVGRGIPAASLMGQLRNGLRAYVVEGRSPAQVLVLLNRLLRDCGAPHQMATLVVMVLDPETGELRYANAGHPPPLVEADDGSHPVPRGRGGRAPRRHRPRRLPGSHLRPHARIHPPPLHRRAGGGPHHAPRRRLRTAAGQPGSTPPTTSTPCASTSPPTSGRRSAPRTTWPSSPCAGWSWAPRSTCSCPPRPGSCGRCGRRCAGGWRRRG